MESVYKVLAPAILRSGFEQSSPKCGELQPGAIVDALESQLSAAGVVRLRTAKGWVSMAASDGTQLLLPLAVIGTGGSD
eukprot:SAG22_NODE_15704_length_342_cov_1.921811_1_plen_78_part_01